MPRQKQQHQTRQKQRADRRRNEDHAALHNAAAEHEQRKIVRPNFEPIEAQTSAQGRYIASIKGKTLTFATGPAGTGKSYLCASLAADALREKRIDKIIVTRPAVEAGENLGFLPGELDEKFDPYIAPLREIFIERLGTGAYEYHLRMGNIEAAPLAYMRGRTFRRAFVILDEAQNTTPVQMKMFLTRIGEDCKVVVNGDIAQKDIHGPSGLEDAVKRVTWIPAVGHVQFTKADIVRSGLVAEIVASYEKEAA
jgi:phosphate starvation-inducible PhoH-like protein